jgi:hypothetical protein
MPPMLSAHVIVITARFGMYLRNKLVVKHRFSSGQLRSEKSTFALPSQCEDTNTRIHSTLSPNKVAECAFGGAGQFISLRLT